MTLLTMPGAIAPGFADAVFDCQDTFRHVLTALSRPGRIETLSRLPEGPTDLCPAAAAVALTLFDFDTPVWLDGSAGSESSELFLRFHCGCPVVETPVAAAFAIIGNPSAMPRLNTFRAGDPLYPDRSATVIVQIGALEGGPAIALRGPGIEDSHTISPKGLPAWFWRDWAVNGTLYPQGVDMLLAAGDAVLGLPRTTRDEEVACTSR